MIQELLFSKYVEQYSLTVPQDAIENELQLLILEEKQRMQYEMLTGAAMHLAPQEELNEKLEAQPDPCRRGRKGSRHSEGRRREAGRHPQGRSGKAGRHSPRRRRSAGHHGRAEGHGRFPRAPE